MLSPHFESREERVAREQAERFDARLNELVALIRKIAATDASWPHRHPEFERAKALYDEVRKDHYGAASEIEKRLWPDPAQLDGDAYRVVLAIEGRN
jgi:hypothetical protein